MLSNEYLHKRITRLEQSALNQPDITEIPSYPEAIEIARQFIEEGVDSIATTELLTAEQQYRMAQAFLESDDLTITER